VVAGRWLCSHAGSNKAQSFSAITCTTQPKGLPKLAAWSSSCWHCSALGKAGVFWHGAPVAKPASALDLLGFAGMLKTKRMMTTMAAAPAGGGGHGTSWHGWRWGFRYLFRFKFVTSVLGGDFCTAGGKITICGCKNATSLGKFSAPLGWR
jgi:hypothetical protein